MKAPPVFMVSFYTELLNGKDKASALRDAKLALLRNEQYRHPYYWAPFIQIGPQLEFKNHKLRSAICLTAIVGIIGGDWI